MSQRTFGIAAALLGAHGIACAINTVFDATGWPVHLRLLALIPLAWCWGTTCGRMTFNKD